MNSVIPKQFLLLGGKPVLMHTINAFQQFNSGIEIILVLPQTEIGAWRDLCNLYRFSAKHTIGEGGDKRFFSVKNAIPFITEKSVVAIHDGVRPFLNSKIIYHGYETAERLGNAIPSIVVDSSIRVIEDGSSKAVDRNLYRIIQTPQFFDSEILKRCYEQEYSENFTDDASVIETFGEKINLIDGDPKNIKITTQQDLLIAEVLFKQP